ncbi:MAG: glycosyltransferase family 4 protein [Thermoplasmata archaeon]|nr:glycosyltransferase family 4 protein [Thermoplasmata archaeon]
MRVLEVTHRYPPALGGVEIQVQAIARGLADRGHRVEIATTDLARDRPFQRFPAPLPPGDFPVRRHRAYRLVPAPHGLGIVAPGMALDLLTSPTDVVHAHAFGMAPTWIAAGVRRVRRTPLVIETHFDGGRGTPGWRLYARSVARLTLAAADRVVAHTRLETDLLTSVGVDPARIVRIPNGIDLTEFHDGPERRPDPGVVTALFVGRLSPERKGLEPLVRAVAALPSNLRLRLRIVGEDWGGRALVVRLARELGVDGKVELVGPLPRERLLGEYASADVFVLPSVFECTPIVLMEAMAAGLPIVTTRVGGIPEVVSEGRNAVLCPPNDPGAVAAALTRFTLDPALRANYGASGRADVVRFSWATVIPQWERLFESSIRAPS